MWQKEREITITIKTTRLSINPGVSELQFPPQHNRSAMTFRHNDRGARHCGGTNAMKNFSEERNTEGHGIAMK